MIILNIRNVVENNMRRLRLLNGLSVPEGYMARDPKLHNKLANILDKGKKAEITTKSGTKLSFSIKGRKAYGRDTGLFTKKGTFGNLPILTASSTLRTAS